MEQKSQAGAGDEEEAKESSGHRAIVAPMPECPAAVFHDNRSVICRAAPSKVPMADQRAPTGVVREPDRMGEADP